jgi:excisionase family DNA binding protein
MMMVDPKPPFVKLWPDAGERLGLSKHSTYEAARLGQIPTVRFGRLIKVHVPTLERLLETGEQPTTRQKP